MLHLKTILLLLVTISIQSAFAQTAARDPRADAVLTSAVAAGLTLRASDEVITGTTTRIGLANPAPISISFKGSDSSLVEYALDGKTRREVRSSAGTSPSGQVTDANGNAISLPLHNCWTPAASFSPGALVFTAQAQSNSSEYVGLETINGLSAQHVRVKRIFNQDAKTADLIARLSQIDLYFDPSSHMLLVVQFNQHADDDYNTDIPVEVRFTDYRPTAAGEAPYRIQKLVGYSVVLDITVSGMSFNTGLSSSVFTLN